MPRRVVFRRFGDVSVLELDTYATPAPGPGEIRVDTAFAGVNYADVIARRGFYKWAPGFPTCVGFELAGTVSAIGPGVTEHAVGDRVLAITRFGGYAEQIVVEAKRAWRVPEGVSLDVAAALPAVYMTAWHSLREVARVRQGDTVLIQAVAGGVGIAALQIAKHLGLITYGTASSDDKLAFAREHGLDNAINYSARDFEEEVRVLTRGRGVDVVLDSLGGPISLRSFRALRRGGRLVVFGRYATLSHGQKDWRAVIEWYASVAAVWLWATLSPGRRALKYQIQKFRDPGARRAGAVGGEPRYPMWFRDDFRALVELLRQGRIHPVVAERLPLSDARRAHELLETSASKGKLVLVP